MISYRYGQGGIRFRQTTAGRSGIATEFGDTGSHSLSAEFYRQGGKVDSSSSRGRSGLSLRYDRYMKYNSSIPTASRRNIKFSNFSQAAKLVEQAKYIGSHRPSQFIYWGYAPGQRSAFYWFWAAYKLRTYYISASSMRNVPHLRVWSPPVGFYIRGDRRQQNNWFVYGKRRRRYTQLRRISIRYPGISIVNQPDRFSNIGGYARNVGRGLPRTGFGTSGRLLRRSLSPVASDWDYDGKRYYSNSSLAIGGSRSWGRLGNERGYFSSNSNKMVYGWPLCVFKHAYIDVYQRRLLFDGLWWKVKNNYFWTDSFYLFIRN